MWKQADYNIINVDEMVGNGWVEDGDNINPLLQTGSEQEVDVFVNGYVVIGCYFLILLKYIQKKASILSLMITDCITVIMKFFNPTLKI